MLWYAMFQSIKYYSKMFFLQLTVQNVLKLHWSAVQFIFVGKRLVETSGCMGLSSQKKFAGEKGNKQDKQ